MNDTDSDLLRRGSGSGEEGGVGSGGGSGEGDVGDVESGGARKRQRSFTPSERARHRVIEKERREAFGSSLLELAGLLPALEGTKQSLLSKYLIVQESIKQLRAQQEEAQLTKRKLLAVTAERDALLMQMSILNSADNLNAMSAGSVQEPFVTQTDPIMQHVATGILNGPLEVTPFGNVLSAPNDLPVQHATICPTSAMPIASLHNNHGPGWTEAEDSADLDLWLQ